MLGKHVLAAGLVTFIVLPDMASAADLPCQQIQLRCRGFEPSWSFVMSGNGTIRFTDPENPNWQTAPIVIQVCAHHQPGQRIGITAGPPLSLSATVKPQQCTEASGNVRPFFIDISYIQGAQTNMAHQASGNGCCWQ